MLTVGVIGALLGFAGAGVMATCGSRWGFIDRPTERSSHRAETPKGSGVGILFAFIMASVWVRLPVLIWISTAGLSVASLLGDRMELSAKLRLTLQFTTAGIAYWQVAKLLPAGIFWGQAGLIVGYLVTSFFVVATANIYNFMDGINGIAAITGIVAFGSFALAGKLRGESGDWVIVAVALAAACAGFLPWNFPRARAFMGDVGSVLLGFIFALYVLVWARSLADLFMFVLFLFPFYVDEALTMWVRFRSQEQLLHAHRRHVYQIMANQMRFAHWKVSLVYGLTQAVVVGAALLVRPLGLVGEAGLSVFLFIVAYLFAKHIRRFEFSFRELPSDT